MFVVVIELEDGDCMTIWNFGLPSGVYPVIPPDGGGPIEVFCEMNEEGGWLVS